MATSEEKSEPTPAGFKVSDRRAFTEAGERRDDEQREDHPAASPAPQVTGGSSDQPAAARRPLPPVDFHTFIISLGSSALLHLGEIERPEGGGPGKDLTMAKHTIDILEMLQAKTKGNLNQQEEKLLDSLLYDLRLRYIEAAKS